MSKATDYHTIDAVVDAGNLANLLAAATNVAVDATKWESETDAEARQIMSLLWIARDLAEQLESGIKVMKP